jgi:FkbM family methyltransferase
MLSIPAEQSSMGDRDMLKIVGVLGLLSCFVATSCRRTHAPTAQATQAAAMPRTDGIDHFSDDEGALAIAARYLPKNPAILEAGAYHGETTGLMARHWPEATIYAFEPVPRLFEIVKHSTAQFPNVHVSDLALSDKVGTATFHISTMEGQPEVSLGSGSLLDPALHKQSYPWVEFTRDITVSTTTIDDWAKAKKIRSVDFIWLDVQGYEFPILKASPAILGTVSVVMTELEFIELYKGQALYSQIKAWFEAQGFALVATDFPLDAPNKASLKNKSRSPWYGNGIFVRRPHE